MDEAELIDLLERVAARARGAGVQASVRRAGRGSVVLAATHLRGVTVVLRPADPEVRGVGIVAEGLTPGLTAKAVADAELLRACHRPLLLAWVWERWAQDGLEAADTPEAIRPLIEEARTFFREA